MWASEAGHYAAANSYLDSVADVRQAAGLPATAVQFGPFAETGMATEYAAALASLGLLSLKPDEVRSISDCTALIYVCVTLSIDLSALTFPVLGPSFSVVQGDLIPYVFFPVYCCIGCIPFH